MMKAATFGILLTAIVLHHNLVGHCQMMGRCGETELYPWINPSAAGKSLTLSCANLCPDQGPNDQMNCSAWYFRNLVDHSFVRTINLIVKQNSSSCGYYYCKDENRNVTLKSALVLTNGSNPVCENLGILNLCLNDQQVHFSYNLFIDEGILDHPCELLRNDQELPCDSNQCQFMLQTFNFSSSYSFRCSVCGGRVNIKSQIFYFYLHQLPLCSDITTDIPSPTTSDSATTRLPLPSPVQPNVVIYGPTEANIESSVSINCTVLEGHPPPNVYIVTPQGKIIDDIIITFIATLQDSGNYTCIANNSVATIIKTHSLIIIKDNDLINSDDKGRTTHSDNEEVIVYVFVPVIVLIIIVAVVCCTCLYRRNIPCFNLKEYPPDQPPAVQTPISGLIIENNHLTPRHLDKLTTLLLQHFECKRLYWWLYPTDCTKQQFQIVWSNTTSRFKNKDHMQVLCILLYWIKSQQKSLYLILSENVENTTCMAKIKRIVEQQSPVHEIDANVNSDKLDRIKLDKIAGKLMAMSVEPVRVAIYLNLEITDHLITSTCTHVTIGTLLNDWLDHYVALHNTSPTEQLLKEILNDMGINGSLCM